MKILHWAQSGVKSYPQGQRWNIELGHVNEKGAILHNTIFYVRLDPERDREYEIRERLHTWAALHFRAWSHRSYRSDDTSDDSNRIRKFDGKEI
jgi:hypothetical protein